MTKDQMNNIALDAFDKIFRSRAMGVDITNVGVQIGEKTFNGRWFKNSVTEQLTLRGFDVQFHTGVGTAKVRFIEQNPNKDNEFARRAANGARIMWIIDQRSNKFLSYVEERVIHEKTAAAVTKAAPPTQAKVASLPPQVRIPEEIEEFAEEPVNRVLNYFEEEGAITFIGGDPTHGFGD
jgi:hypothetical protein